MKSDAVSSMNDRDTHLSHLYVYVNFQCLNVVFFFVSFFEIQIKLSICFDVKRFAIKTEEPFDFNWVVTWSFYGTIHSPSWKSLWNFPHQKKKEDWSSSCSYDFLPAFANGTTVHLVQLKVKSIIIIHFFRNWSISVYNNREFDKIDLTQIQKFK